MANQEIHAIQKEICCAASGTSWQPSRQAIRLSVLPGVTSKLDRPNLLSQNKYFYNLNKRRAHRASTFWRQSRTSATSPISNATAMATPTSATSTNAPIFQDENFQTNPPPALTMTNVAQPSTQLRNGDTRVAVQQQQTPLKKPTGASTPRTAGEGRGKDVGLSGGVSNTPLRHGDDGARQHELNVKVVGAYHSGANGVISNSSSPSNLNYTAVEPDNSDRGSGIFWDVKGQPMSSVASNTHSSRLPFSGRRQDLGEDDEDDAYEMTMTGGDGGMMGISTTCAATLTRSNSCNSIGSSFFESLVADGTDVSDGCSSGYDSDSGSTSSRAHQSATANGDPNAVDSINKPIFTRWKQLVDDLCRFQVLTYEEPRARIKIQQALKLAKDAVGIAKEAEADGQTPAKGCSASIAPLPAVQKFVRQYQEGMKLLDEMDAMLGRVLRAGEEFPVYDIAYQLEAAASAEGGARLFGPAVEAFEEKVPEGGLPGRAVVLLRCLLLVANYRMHLASEKQQTETTGGHQASNSNTRNGRGPLPRPQQVDGRMEMACLRPLEGGLMALVAGLLAHHGISTPLLYHEYELLWNMLVELHTSSTAKGSLNGLQFSFHPHITTMDNLTTLIRSYTASAGGGGVSGCNTSRGMGNLRLLRRPVRIEFFTVLVREHFNGVQKIQEEEEEHCKKTAAMPRRGRGGDRHRGKRSATAVAANGGGSVAREREVALKLFKGWTEGWVKSVNRTGHILSSFGNREYWALPAGGGSRDAEPRSVVKGVAALVEQWQKVVCKELPVDGKLPIVLRNLSSEGAARAEFARELLALEASETSQRSKQVVTVGTEAMLLALRTAAVVAELRAAASPAGMHPPKAPKAAAVVDAHIMGTDDSSAWSAHSGPVGVQLHTSQILQTGHEGPTGCSNPSRRQPCVVAMQLVTCPVRVRAVIDAEVAAAMAMKATAAAAGPGTAGTSVLISAPEPGDSGPYDVSRKLTPQQLELRLAVAAALSSRRMAILQPESEAALESALVMLAQCRTDPITRPGRTILVVPYIPNLATHITMRNPIRQLQQMVGMTLDDARRGVSSAGGPQDQEPRCQADPLPEAPTHLRDNWRLRRRLGLTCLLTHFSGWSDGASGDGDPSVVYPEELSYRQLAGQVRASSCEPLPLPLLVVLDCAAVSGEVGILERGG